MQAAWRCKPQMRDGSGIPVLARLCIARAQALSHAVAPESSPRRQPWVRAQWWRSPGRGDRSKSSNSFAAPRLLTFNAAPHGWRRGLLSGAAPQLTPCTPLPLRCARWELNEEAGNRLEIETVERPM